MFENEDLRNYLESENVGYGDKLTRLVELLNGNNKSIINRIKGLTNMTRSSYEFVNSVVKIINGDGPTAVTKSERRNWCMLLPVTPPTINKGDHSFDSSEVPATSDGIVKELNVLVSRVGVVRAGYILEKLSYIDGTRSTVDELPKD